MNNFSYRNSTQIHFGQGQIAKIRDEMPANARVLITYGGGSIKKNGVMEQVHAALEGVTYFEFGGIEPNPHFETLMKAVDVIKQENINFILAVGGGSVIDGSKFIAAAALYPNDPWEIIQTYGAKVTQAVPLGCVLTLAATGSEMNNGGVITIKAIGAKLPFLSKHVFPRFSVLDPTKTYTLPQRQLANGVVDAFIHVMEQYLTYPVGGFIQDRFAESLLLTLIEHGPQAVESTDYIARANLMWTATLALNGLIAAGVPSDWGTHMIGHEITAKYGIDHARTLAVVLPAMMQIRRVAKHEKLLQYAKRVWDITEGSDDEIIDAAIAKTRAFFESLGLPTRLSAYDIGEDGITAIIKQLEEHGMVALGERHEVTLAESRKVLEAAQ